MKKNLILCILIFLCFSNLLNAQAPNWLWVKSAGGNNGDYTESITTDNSGNVFITGSFGSTALSFGSTTLTNSGFTDVFIVKYDPNGNVLWAKSAGGNFFDFGYGVTTDPIGNLYVTGSFESQSITFGSITLTSTGNGDDIFIVKYDPNGNILWVKQESKIVFYETYGISTDTSGNLYLSAMFADSTITFGTTVLTNASNLGTFDLCLVKYDPSGNVLWAKSAGGPGSEFSNLISTDVNGNIYIAGYFDGQSFTFGSSTLPTSGTFDILLVKYSANGNELWATSVGDIQSDFGRSVTTDTSGNVFITGAFASSTLNFGASTIINSGDFDVFIAKYNANGFCLWAKNFGGVNDDFSYKVVSDITGNVYMTGEFQSSTVTVGGITLNNLGSVSIPIVKYDTNGNVIWAKSVGGNISGGQAKDMAIDINENILITGPFSTSISFDSISIFTIDSSDTDLFIAKLDATPVGIEELSVNSEISIAPNPFSFETTLIFKEEQKNTRIKILDVLGKEIFSTTFSGKQLVIQKGEMKPGIYFVQSIDEKKNVTNKKIIVQ